MGKIERGLHCLIDKICYAHMIPQEKVFTPEKEYISQIANDFCLYNIYRNLEAKPFHEDELCEMVNLTRDKLGAYLEMLNQRGAIRKQHLGKRFLLTLQGCNELSLVDRELKEFIVKSLEDMLTNWQKKRALFSTKYALKMFQKYGNDDISKKSKLLQQTLIVD